MAPACLTLSCAVVVRMQCKCKGDGGGVRLGEATEPHPDLEAAIVGPRVISEI
jgi:hypothetical protein